MTRAEYLRQSGDPKQAHRTYYSQFVDERVLTLVSRRWDVEFLVEQYAYDKHLNCIPLNHWDALVNRLPTTVPKKMEELGDYLTLGGGVCVLKEAARQLVEKFLAGG